MSLASRDRDALQNHQAAVKVNLRPLREFLLSVRRELKLAKSEITIRLINDTEMKRLNKLYRGKNKATDVLSFPTRELKRPVRSANRLPLVKDEQLGDIAISPSVARRYAKKHGRSFINEMRILILHGVLHLLGYDHEADNGEMDQVETRFRQRLGLQ